MPFVARAIATSLLASSLATPVAAAWPPLGGLGVTVCDTTGFRNGLASVGDGSGGAYFMWLDWRDEANRRFFAQRVSGSGVALWLANGISVGSTMAFIHPSVGGGPPVIVSDDQGGALVLWSDFRADTAGNLYAQRLAPDGTLLWGPDAVPVNLGPRHEVSFVAESDGAGGMFVVWRDDRDSIFTTRAQRVDAAGSLLWGEDGVVVCPNHLSQTSQRLASDGLGGALVAWTEVRGGQIHGFAQRLNAGGEPQWATLGVQLSTSPHGTFVNDIEADGSGGMVVAWLDYRSLNTWTQAFAQRVTADGNVAWAPDGVSLSGTTWYVNETFVLGDGNGGAIVGWQDYRNNGWNAAMAQRLSPTGAKLWTLPAVEVGQSFGGSGVNQVRMLADGADGAVFVWNSDDGGDVSDEYSIYAQRVGSTGAPIWSSGGVVLASLHRLAGQLVAVPDGSGGVVAGWLDQAGFGGPPRYAAQRVAGSGTLSVPQREESSLTLACVPTPARASEGVELRLAPVVGSRVGVGIYDLGGRLVRSFDEPMVGATGRLRWDGRDAEGRSSPPGLYFVTVRSGIGVGRARIVIVE